MPSGKEATRFLPETLPGGRGASGWSLAPVLFVARDSSPRHNVARLVGSHRSLVMKRRESRMKPLTFLLALLAVGSGAGRASAQGTAFTYQGQILDTSVPANGAYDLTFSLFNAGGDGSQVGVTFTNLATPITDGRFTLTLDFGPGAFNGAARWLQIGVRTNGAGGFAALEPRQALLPAPYAILASTASNLIGSLPISQLSGSLPSNLLAGTYTQPLSFTNAANYFGGSGGGLTGVNAATLGGLGGTNFWMTGGNSGAKPSAGSFLGTTDSQPLELRVNGVRALRLEPASGIPNVICGCSNAVAADVFGGAIGGGTASYIDTDSWNCTIGGGTNNIIADTADESSIGGGAVNQIGSGANDSVIAGGSGNAIGAGSDHSTIGGGEFNNVGAPSSAVGGGEFNGASGYASTVPGGAGNMAAGDYSLAAGDEAYATNAGAFVWADSQPYVFGSGADNEFSARATGGVRFVSGLDANGSPVSGVHLAAGGGSWSSLSDRNAKEHIQAVDAREVLRRLTEIPIATWSYRSQESAVRHMGPMAQDFARAFGLGEDDRHITTIDADGVALAAIQGLNQKVEEKDARLQEQEFRIRGQAAEITELKGRLLQLEQLMNRQTGGSK